jgi:hypothetical protein
VGLYLVSITLLDNAYFVEPAEAMTGGHQAGGLASGSRLL